MSKEQDEKKPVKSNQVHQNNNGEQLSFEQRKELGLALIARFRKVLQKLRER